MDKSRLTKEQIEKTHPTLFEVLEDLETFIGAEIVIHVTYDLEGHAPDSCHKGVVEGKAVAADLHFKSTLKYSDLVERVLMYFRFYKGKTGIGLYPDWASKGFHIDLRGLRGIKYPTARWGRIGTKYVSMDVAKKYMKLKGY